MRKMGGKKGFTLVELALSVGFIAMLSLTITLIINDTAATYRRGITLNQVNTTGMDLVDDFRAAIQNSPARQPSSECGEMYNGAVDAGEPNAAAQKCADDYASSMIILRRMGYVDTDEDGQTEDDPIPVYGAICMGSFTYIWNSGYFYGENAGEAKANMFSGTSRVPKDSKNGIPLSPAELSYMVTYIDEDGNLKERQETKSGFRLLKVKDVHRGICKNVLRKSAGNGGITSQAQMKNYQPSTDFDNDLPNVFVANVKETNNDRYVDYFPQGLTADDIEVVLDDTSTNPLALYDFTITPPVSNSSGESSFYSASFILGTLTGGINVKAKGNFCKTPDAYDEDFDYCAINKFNFAAQATGG